MNSLLEFVKKTAEGKMKVLSQVRKIDLPIEIRTSFASPDGRPQYKENCLKTQSCAVIFSVEKDGYAQVAYSEAIALTAEDKAALPSSECAGKIVATLSKSLSPSQRELLITDIISFQNLWKDILIL
jgi:hypothetical protein